MVYFHGGFSSYSELRISCSRDKGFCFPSSTQHLKQLCALFCLAKTDICGRLQHLKNNSVGSQRPAELDAHSKNHALWQGSTGSLRCAIETAKFYCSYTVSPWISTSLWSTKLKIKYFCALPGAGWWTLRPDAK